MGILIAIFIFAFIIIIHEAGHFYTARFFGVKVEEFGLGLPPRAKKLFTDKKGTLFSLNWLPIGGFVRIKGESPVFLEIYDINGKIIGNKKIENYIQNNIPIYDKEKNIINDAEKIKILKEITESKQKDNFINTSFIGKICILAGGVIMNFILAFLIFWILFFVGVKPFGVNTIIDTKIESHIIPSYEKSLELGFIKKGEGIVIFPLKDSPAEKSGLENKDIILKIDGVFINSPEKIQEIIQKNNGKTKKFEIKREENIILKNIKIPEDGKIGIQIGENINIDNDFLIKKGFLESGKYAFNETFSQIELTFRGIGKLFKSVFNPEKPEERKEAVEQMSGPIGIVNFIGENVNQGWIFLLILTAVISINLGVFNILPIPALDGGRIVFVIIRKITQIFFPDKEGYFVENFINLIFFAILIALAIFIGYNDIMKIFS